MAQPMEPEFRLPVLENRGQGRKTADTRSSLSTKSSQSLNYSFKAERLYQEIKSMSLE